MPNDEMKKNAGEEIVNVAATITIAEAVIAYKEKKYNKGCSHIVCTYKEEKGGMTQVRT